MKNTLVLPVDSKKPDLKKVRLAADLIKKGGLVAFPTETVYGLGADALNTKAVLALFRAKKRPLDNPPIVHISDSDFVCRLAKSVPDTARELMKTFWPGPLTLIFHRASIVPDVTVAGLETIAIRIPNHKVALTLIEESGCPIAAPSANLAGKPSPTSAKHVLDDLNGKVDAILDAGSADIGVESTVLDLTADPPQVLRPGGTPFEALKDVLENVELSPFVFSGKLVHGEARSPGLKHKHYAPVAEMVVVEGNVEAVVYKIGELARLYRAEGRRVGVLATDETIRLYSADVRKSLGSRGNPGSLAKSLFRLLREFDDDNVDVIIAEGVPMKDVGLAVMNRLRKASGHRIVKANKLDA